MASTEEQKVEQKVGLTITVRLQDGTQTSFKARERTVREAAGTLRAADAAEARPAARR